MSAASPDHYGRVCILGRSCEGRGSREWGWRYLEWFAGSPAESRDFLATLRDFHALLRDFLVVLRVFHPLLRDFLALLRNSHTISRVSHPVLRVFPGCHHNIFAIIIVYKAGS